MKYLSVCSGIEAATVAWHPLGWEPVAFGEIEPFPCSVLAHHYPEVPNLGDMTKHESWSIEDGAVDLLVGGTPCQSFSVAGLRKGLADPRGNLALVYLGILDRVRPRWCVWENVPGVLSSNGGRDFGSFLGALGELGYGWAYRVLDAQHFGVAQRRRRVFVVGHARGAWQRAATVLLEPESVRRNRQTCGREGQGIAGGTERDAASHRQHPLITFHWNAKPDEMRFSSESTATLTTTQQPAVFPALDGDLVRRLTPRECERLQGFPDDYTLVSHRGKPAADAPRYKAIGNSMAVPVMRWIGRRIQAVDSIGVQT